MLAAIITEFGGPGVLDVRDVPDPRPGPREVLVRVRASALNRADILQRTGRYPPPPGAPAEIPGIEFAGEVEALGPGVSRWSVGDRVFSIAGGGGHATLCVAHEEALARIPPVLDWIQAAAIPEAFITAHDAMIVQAGLRSGESVLVQAAGSGVGLAAIQLARAWGASPFGASRTAAKLERARTLGLADGVVVDGDPASLGAAVARWTGGRGVDVVLDLVGGAMFRASVDALAPRGRLMAVGTMGGAEVTLDLRRVLGRRLTIRGTVLRSRPLAEKVAAVSAFERDVVPLLGSGALAAVVDSVFPLGAIRAAHERMESNETFGKVVVEMPAA